jgi:tetratricopeptide (TPR) repeat protein
VASLEEIVECANDISQETPLEHVEASAKSQDGPSVALWLVSYLKHRTAPTLVLVVAAAGLLLGLGQMPKFARYFNNRGVVHQQKGDIGAAIVDYRWALRFSPGYAAAHYNLGDAYEEIPDYVKALEQYQSAIDVDPTFYPAYNNLSRLCILRQKDYGAAMRLLDRALSFQPKEPSVQYTLYKNYGWADLEMGQFGQAEHNLRIAAGLNSQRGSAHCLLAKVLEAQKRGADALPEWESCLGYSNQPEVEPEWRNEAHERLGAQEHRSGG